MFYYIIMGFVATYAGVNGKFAICGWIGALFILFELQNTEKRKYESGVPDMYYPINKLIKPEKCKFLFEKSNLPSQGIPREWYYYRVLSFYGFCVYTLIAIGVAFINQRAAGILFLVYVIIVGVCGIIVGGLENRRKFYAYFKKLTIHNLIYRIIGFNYPPKRKKGKCKIVSEYVRKNKTYVTVKMLETGEIKENILFAGVKKQGKDPTYNLYEICKVFYVI